MSFEKNNALASIYCKCDVTLDELYDYFLISVPQNQLYYCNKGIFHRLRFDDSRITILQRTEVHFIGLREKTDYKRLLVGWSHWTVKFTKHSLSRDEGLSTKQMINHVVRQAHACGLSAPCNCLEATTQVLGTGYELHALQLKKPHLAEIMEKYPAC